MTYRKKHVEVTNELLNDILWDVKRKFHESAAPDYLKRLLKKIEPNFLIVDRPKWRLYGEAYATSKKYKKKDLAKKMLKLNVRRHPSINIDGDDYFLILLINRGAYHRITRRGLRYIVAHELAHLLQIVWDEEVEGGTSYSTDKDHDHRWFRLARWMGCPGTELIEPDHVWC